MKILPIISGFLLIVYGEATKTPTGYFYPPPSSLPQNPTPKETIDINKFVYFFKAPPSEKKPTKKPTIDSPPPKKNYKIIFIQAPEPPAPVIPELPIVPQNEEKTIVYVLNKKPEEQPTILLPTPKPTKPSSPEVYFINYGLKKDNITLQEQNTASDQPEIPSTEVPKQYIPPPSTEAPFKIPSQYLPPATQYGLQGTLDIPADVLSKDSETSRYFPPQTSYEVSSTLPPTTLTPADAVSKSEPARYLPPKTSYGVPIEPFVSPETSKGVLIGEDNPYQGQVRNSRSALRSLFDVGFFEPYLYFQRQSAVS